VHEFADSQFGHIFARGETREAARRNLVLAIKNLSIRFVHDLFVFLLQQS
jgi:biotin carboxylase